MSIELATKPDLAQVLARFEPWRKREPLERSLVTIEVEPPCPPKTPRNAAREPGSSVA